MLGIRMTSIKGDQMPTSVTLQYFDGCPNWKQAERDLQDAVEQIGVDVDLVFEKIESHKHAEDAGFRGSPTILIGGHDPFADADAPVGLSCRVYRTGERPSGSPGVDALKVALRSALP
jgi:hypothetical protein